MHVGQAGGPAVVDVRHVHPRYVEAGEGVQQALFWFVYLNNLENVVDVADDGETGI
jgi:hypothetical protein